MAQKYHINKHGVPAPCHAKKGNCPLGGDEQHFNSQEEAQQFADEQNAKDFGVFSVVRDEHTDEFMEKVYYPDNDPNRVGWDFQVYTNQVEEGDWDWEEASDSLKKRFLDEFGKDKLVVETAEDPLKYSLDSYGDGPHYDYDDILEQLTNEGYDTNKISKHYGEYRSDFREAYSNYLKSKEGPTKEIFGKQMNIVEKPFAKSNEDFFRSYLKAREPEGNTSVSSELEQDFNDNAYYPSHEASYSQYVQRIDEIDGDIYIDDAKNPEAIRQTFRDNFNKHDLVVEIEDNNPMSYSLDSYSDGIVEAHQNLFNKVENDGYDLNVIYTDRYDEEYTDEFRDSYTSYLKSRQGPTKELFGKKLASIPDFDEDEGVEDFIKTFIKNRE